VANTGYLKKKGKCEMRNEKYNNLSLNLEIELHIGY